MSLKLALVIVCFLVMNTKRCNIDDKNAQNISLGFTKVNYNDQNLVHLNCKQQNNEMVMRKTGNQSNVRPKKN